MIRTKIKLERDICNICSVVCNLHSGSAIHQLPVRIILWIKTVCKIATGEIILGNNNCRKKLLLESDPIDTNPDLLRGIILS
ncbi:hypothetical protein SDC9_72685 [bioreactor metagenome]|uniref:Uncharacterized protein n=1 Tax=bioreactor metagenome TaxID=1076179 RepID=A0A644YJ88_9ZZZZ